MTGGTRVAGIDFGTDSVRVSVWDVEQRQAVATVSAAYPRWAAGQFCVPAEQRFRQHPLDHLEALTDCFGQVAALLGDGSVAALAVDSTGSTPAPVDRSGRPLALLPEHAEDPDCMFWLWKDHTATAEAATVDAALRAASPDFTSLQGTYSSEWWWAKILRGATTSSAVAGGAASWVEHSDWVPNLLVGRDDVTTFSRNACAAGHKALVNRRLGGMVPEAILAGLHPHLAAVARTFRTPPDPAGTPLGTLTPQWAARLRLHPDVVVAAGSLDAHAGAVGAGIAPGTLVMVLGTSAVHLFLTDYEALGDNDLRDHCGVAEDSILPGHLGAEAGQAAFGDLLAWYGRLLAWPLDHVLRPRLDGMVGADVAAAVVADVREAILPGLERAVLEAGPDDVVALDWLHGRRYPVLDDAATAALLDLRIAHDAVSLYDGLVRAAVLGSRAVLDGVADVARVERVVLVGGVVRRSALVRQSVADALARDVMLCPEDEAGAKGAAMYAAVAAGRYATLPEAQAAWCPPFTPDHRPRPAAVAAMARAYRDYRDAAELDTARRARRVGRT